MFIKYDFNNMILDFTIIKDWLFENFYYLDGILVDSTSSLLLERWPTSQ